MILKVLPRLFHSQSKSVKILERIHNNRLQIGSNYVYVISSGYKFAGRAVLVTANRSRFLFNCSPGTSRTLTEHNGKYRNLSAILATRPTWENIGGVPSVLLKLNDTRSKECSVFGFPNIDTMLNTGRNFLHFHHTKMTAMKGGYVDENVNIVQIKLSPQCGYNLLRRESKVNEDSFQDSVNVFAYILKTNPSKEKSIDVEKMLDMGISPGRHLVDLLNGKSVTLPNGDVVNPADIVTPAKVNSVVVVECPAEDYLKSLEDNEHVRQSQINSEECNTIVIHFSPPSVMNRPRYVKWMKQYSPSTIHLIVNESNLSDCLLTLRYRQHLLSKLHPGLFPPLRDTGYYWIKGKHHTSKNQEYVKHSQMESFQETENPDFFQEEATYPEKPVKGSLLWLSEWEKIKDMNIYEARPGTRIPFRTFRVERIAETLFDELTYYEGFKSSLPEEILSNIRKRFLDIGVDVSKPLRLQAEYENAYPRVIFLGTASKTDSRDRNVSGILLRISKKSNIILDCGEGTHSQIHRLFGDKAPEIFRSINAVYISHMHADHHMGLIDIIRERAKAFGDEKPSPLLLFAPSHMERWLDFTMRYLPYEQQIRHVHLQDLLTNAVGDQRTAAMKAMDHIYSRTGILKIQTIRVPHCNEAYAVAFQHADGWKITYSGDSMFTGRLQEIGQGSDLLIHEATYDDEHEHLAIKNRHCTVGQAIEIGRKMNAKFTILTHVSQRYSIIPAAEMSTDFSFAFDFMQVPLRYCHHMPILHELYSYLSNAYLNDDSSEELTGQKRQLNA